MALPIFNLVHIDGGADDHVDGSSVGNDAPRILEDPYTMIYGKYSMFERFIIFSYFGKLTYINKQ